MAKVITITCQKGGVAKTTTALALASGLYSRGKKILLIDTDPQSNTSYTLGIDLLNVPTLYEVLRKEKTVSDVIFPVRMGFDVIPGSLSLALADMEFSQTGREYLLRESLTEIQEEYDYIVIDTPPSLGILTMNALTASNYVIVPVQADVYSLQGIGQLSQTMQTVKRYCNPGLTIAGILITRYNSRAVLSKDMAAMLDDTAKALNTRLFKTKIRECIAIKEAQAQQMDIFTYAPKSNAAKDYDNMIEELMEVVK